MLIVQKYGGSSVADKNRIFHVAKIIEKTYKENHRLVVVLSAQGDTTDRLLEKAYKLSDAPSKRELDMLLTTGEQQSVALMALALNSIGLPAISLNAYQVGIYTSAEYGNAKIKAIDTQRIVKELDNKKIVLVTGFQGINDENDITTLGRNGSDTTAVALAAELEADLCEIYTDVDGVYSSDPRIIKNARKIDEISYDEMLEMSMLGAKVLHNRSVELAKQYGVNLCVRSSMTEAEGTRIVDDEFENDVKNERLSSKLAKRAVIGVASDLDVCKVSVKGVAGEKNGAFKLFSLLAVRDVNVDIIIQSINNDFSRDITFTVSKSDAKKTVGLISENLAELGAASVHTDDTLAKISIVGAGMVSDPGVAAKMFEVIYEQGSDIVLITTSEIKISVLVKAEGHVRILQAVHDKFNFE